MDERLKKIIDNSASVVFFGGAGVSTESNIPDFRSEKGLYSAQQQYGYSPEQMLSHSHEKWWLYTAPIMSFPVLHRE